MKQMAVIMEQKMSVRTKSHLDQEQVLLLEDVMPQWRWTKGEICREKGHHRFGPNDQ